jgi:hypothetical protein
VSVVMMLGKPLHFQLCRMDVAQMGNAIEVEGLYRGY